MICGIVIGISMRKCVLRRMCIIWDSFSVHFERFFNSPNILLSNTNVGCVIMCLVRIEGSRVYAHCCDRAKYIRVLMPRHNSRKLLIDWKFGPKSIYTSKSIRQKLLAFLRLFAIHSISIDPSVTLYSFAVGTFRRVESERKNTYSAPIETAI